MAIIRKPLGRVKPPLGAQLDWGDPISQGLVGCWLMNEGGAKTNLDIARIQNGSFLAAHEPSWSVGKFGYGVKFNGAGTTYYSVDTTCTLTLGDFSCVVWFISLAHGIGGVNTGYDRIVDKTYSAGFVMCRAADANNSWSAYVVDSGASAPITVTLTDNVWHQMVLTRAGSSCTVYGDGGAVKTTVTRVSTALSSDILHFGWSNVAADYNVFNGIIDHCRLYSRALSPNEISRLYTEPFAGIVQPRIVLGRNAVAAAGARPRLIDGRLVNDSLLLRGIAA